MQARQQRRAQQVGRGGGRVPRGHVAPAQQAPTVAARVVHARDAQDHLLPVALGRGRGGRRRHPVLLPRAPQPIRLRRRHLAHQLLVVVAHRGPPAHRTPVDMRALAIVDQQHEHRPRDELDQHPASRVARVRTREQVGREDRRVALQQRLANGLRVGGGPSGEQRLEGRVGRRVRAGERQGQGQRQAGEDSRMHGAHDTSRRHRCLAQCPP